MAHTVILVAVLLCVLFVQFIMGFLHASDHKLFDAIPFSWVFDASETCLVIAFVIASGRQAWRRFNDDGV